ncbi:MAG: hypothetical protein ACE5JI_02720 [Acidobacteriota bacterium]
MKHQTRLLAGGAAALLISFLAWEWYLSPTARLERFLSDAAEAAEERDGERLLTFFSRNYRDHRNLDYQTLAKLVDEGFSRVDRLNVTLQRVRPRIHGDQATASLDLMVVGIRGQQRYLLVGAPMQPEKLQVELAREEGKWRILSVKKGARP